MIDIMKISWIQSLKIRWIRLFPEIRCYSQVPPIEGLFGESSFEKPITAHIPPALGWAAILALPYRRAAWRQQRQWMSFHWTIITSLQYRVFDLNEILQYLPHLEDYSTYRYINIFRSLYSYRSLLMFHDSRINSMQRQETSMI